ncbi:unnamed protein product [Merluccius merluccius]
MLHGCKLEFQSVDCSARPIRPALTNSSSPLLRGHSPGQDPHYAGSFIEEQRLRKTRPHWSSGSRTPWRRIGRWGGAVFGGWLGIQLSRSRWGATDGCQRRIKLPGEADAQCYPNRKPFPSTQLQAVCHHRDKAINVSVHFCARLKGPPSVFVSARGASTTGYLPSG